MSYAFIVLLYDLITYSFLVIDIDILGHSFCPVASATRSVGYATRVLDTCRISNASSSTGHWTEAKPDILDHLINLFDLKSNNNYVL